MPSPEELKTLLNTYSECKDMGGMTHKESGPSPSISTGTDDRNNSSNNSDNVGIRLRTNMTSDNYIACADKKCFQVACLGTLVWMILVILSYAIAIRSNKIEKLTGTEQQAPMVGSLLLGMSIVSYAIPFSYKKIKGEHMSGVVAAGILVQVVAFLTDAMLCTLPVPVYIDPFTGAKVYPLRWAEWTPLSFVMTFMTEACHVNIEILENDSTTVPLQGIMGVVKSDYDESLNYSKHQEGHEQQKSAQKEKTTKVSSDGTDTESTPLIASSIDDDTKLFNFDDANSLGWSQSLSTLCGFLFPYCTNKVLWMTLLVVSCILFCFIYHRLVIRYFEFKKMKIGSSLGEQEAYHSARLSLGLLTTCAIMWSILVVGYFAYSFGPMIYPDNKLLTSKGIVMICESGINVLFKGIFLVLIVDVHNAIFDPGARAQRRLNELRQMMGVVWDNSSDVIGVSIKNISGDVTTLLSPTFHKLYSDNVKTSDTAETDMDRIQNLACAFELDAQVMNYSEEKLRSQQILPSSVYDVEFGGISGFTKIRNGKTTKENLASMSQLVVKCWKAENEVKMHLHDMVLGSGNLKKIIRCEANISRLEQNAIVIVVRNISERFRRFEAEKKAISETTARMKDADANRFTRHEVKNGLLAAIGLCDSLKENGNKSSTLLSTSASSNNEISHSQQIVLELGSTLHEILDTILAEAMARDVIHEVYEPKLERVNVANLIHSTMKSTASAESMKRFPVVTKPSPLPEFALDPQLLKYIHRNAVSNACKYGKRGGVVMTEIEWHEATAMLQLKVINLPGDKHEEILALGNLAAEIIFSPTKRLPVHSGDRGEVASHSAGDGAWIMYNCAKTLKGTCDVQFDTDRTTFTVTCPVRPFNEVLATSSMNPLEFSLPINVYAIALDDSKIQRKLLARFFSFCKIPEDRIHILGGSCSEIQGFNDWAVNFIVEHPDDYFLCIVDENLDVHQDQIAERDGTISGSECVATIRRRILPDQERRVLALIRSANDSANDVAIYNSRAHGFLPKAPIKQGTVLEEIAPLWLSRFPDFCAAPTFSRVPSEHLLPTCILDCGSEAATTARDLIESLSSIRNLLSGSSHDDMKKEWPRIWEKLHILKGDLLTLSNVENKELIAIADMIESMKGETMTSDFIQNWEIIHSFIIAAL